MIGGEVHEWNPLSPKGQQQEQEQDIQPSEETSLMSLESQEVAAISMIDQME